MNMEVVKSFIKSGMSGDLDPSCIWVVSKDISSGLGDKTKQYSFLGMGEEFCLLSTWR